MKYSCNSAISLVTLKTLVSINVLPWQCNVCRCIISKGDSCSFSFYEIWIYYISFLLKFIFFVCVFFLYLFCYKKNFQFFYTNVDRLKDLRNFLNSNGFYNVENVEQDNLATAPVIVFGLVCFAFLSWAAL